MCKDKFDGKQKYEDVSQWNFESESQWRAHMNKVHNESLSSQNSSTKRTDSKTDSPKTVSSGYQENHDTDLKCTMCGKFFINESSLRFHIINGHMINDPVYINVMIEETKIVRRSAGSVIVNPKMSEFANFGITYDKSQTRNNWYTAKPYQCALCYSGLDSKEKLLTHMVANHESKHPYQCSICDKPLKSKSSLESHITMAHKKEESNPCFMCHAGFFTKSDLARHVYDEHFIPPISGIICQCPLCFIPILGAGSISRNGIKYVQAQARSKLRIHLLDCIEKKSDVCFMCKVRFENEAELKNHMNSHETISITEDICKKCLNDDKEHCKECGCMKCGGKTPVERLIFCEKCQFYIHFECLPHPIESLEELPGGSDTDFFCPSCSDENLKEILDSQMLDGLKNETRSPKLEEMEMDKIQSNFNEFDPLALETQDISLKPELDIGSNIVQNTVIMEPKQAAYKKDQDYWSGIEWKGHMKPVHQMEYQVFEQNPDYYPSDIKDCNIEVVAPTNLIEDIKPVEVFEPAYSKEFNQNFDYPIDFLTEKTNNAEVDGVVVKQISEDFAEEHKFTSFSQLETEKIEDIQYC